MSPRKRKSKNQKLPAYVYLKKGRYVLVEYNRETKKQRETRLCSGDATIPQVWNAYEKRTAAGASNTFRWLSGQYLKSPQYLEKSSTTQRDYGGYHRRICNKQMTDGSKFGDWKLATWSTAAVRLYLDRRIEEGAAVGGNREKAYISLVFSWGIERGHHHGTNPAKGVRRSTERARTRYVTDEEYQTALDKISAHSQPYLVVVMELAYLLRARLAEVLDLTRDSLLTEGVYLVRRKGSRDAITRWSPRLRAAVKLAKSQQHNQFGPHLVQAKGGDRLSESTVQTAWGRLMREHWEGERFTLHDLKAKGITDSKDKSKAGGHKDPRMIAVYDRLPIDVEATD